MKKFLSFTTVLAISFGCLTACGSSSDSSEESTTIFSDFSLDGNHVTYNGDCTSKVIDIPNEINGETVKTIDSLEISYMNSSEQSEKLNSITKIIIPETVIDCDFLSISAFKNLKECEVAESNPVYCSIDGVVYSKDKTKLCYVPTAKGDYKIPEHVTEIESFAFYHWCSTQLYIPNTVKEIGLIRSAKLTIFLDDSFKNDTDLINSLVKKDDFNEINVKCGGEEYSGIDAYNEKKLEELRNKTFSGNRRLYNLSSLDYSNEEYEDATNSGIQVNSVSAKIEGKELVLTISVKSKVEYSADCIVSIGYYNAAGELKGSADCDMGIIPGLGSDEATFRGEPNCIDYLYYYKVKSVVQSTRR